LIEKGLWYLVMNIRPKERVRKGKERIEESGEMLGSFG
jgi:hypothetical protein